MNLHSSRDWASPCTPCNSHTARDSCLFCGAATSSLFDHIQQQQQQEQQQELLKFDVLRAIFTDSVVASLNLFSGQKQPQQQQMKNTNVGCFREEMSIHSAAAAAGTSSSESGWTAYLDQSQSHSKRLRQQSSLAKGAPGSEENQSSLVEGGEEFRDDPSMASDASSGPQLQGCAQKKKRYRSHREGPAAPQVRDIDLEDTCQSNLSCESVSDESRSNRQQFCKRRKTSHEARHASQIDESCSDENDVEIESGEAEISSHPLLAAENIHKDAVNSRLEVLQHLIPNSRELDEEQVLEVAIDYVKSLEQKIKMFEANNNAFAEASSTSNNKNNEPSFQQSRSASAGSLQGKGWCLMPISVVDSLTTAGTASSS